MPFLYAFTQAPICMVALCYRWAQGENYTQTNIKESKVKKTTKLQPGNNGPQDMIEVKSASGKSMLISKAVLEKVMSSKGIQSKVQKAIASKRSTDEKLLAEENDFA